MPRNPMDSRVRGNDLCPATPWIPACVGMTYAPAPLDSRVRGNDGGCAQHPKRELKGV